jgi:large subunit ribosomal protein L18
MISKKNKNALRKQRAVKVRSKVQGTPDRPRLNVYRSLTHIYAQVIDDVNGVTLVSASTANKELAAKLQGKTKTEAATMVGETVAKLATQKGIKQVVFDRAGYLYTGRVKALADGARSAGLEF